MLFLLGILVYSKQENCTMNECPECGSPNKYSAEYDTYYCERCNLWLEEKCNDPECQYCNKRPAYPSEQEAT